MCWVIAEGGRGLDGYQPGVYVSLKALFLVRKIIKILWKIK